MLRLVVGVTAAFGPLFLFAVLIDKASLIAAKLGLNETFVSANMRWIVAIGLLGSLAVSHLLLLLARRAFPSPRTDAHTRGQPRLR